MARILAIDYGKKRCGIATTDPLQLIATGLDTVDTPQLQVFLDHYCKTEEVEAIVFGLPTHSDGQATYLEERILIFIAAFQKKFPQIRIERQDEAYSSRDARQAILMSGAGKKKRRDKALVDKVSAVIILQDFMGFR